MQLILIRWWWWCIIKIVFFLFCFNYWKGSLLYFREKIVVVAASYAVNTVYVLSSSIHNIVRLIVFG